jgi:hypothetical protein
VIDNRVGCAGLWELFPSTRAFNMPFTRKFIQYKVSHSGDRNVCKCRVLLT